MATVLKTFLESGWPLQVAPSRAMAAVASWHQASVQLLWSPRPACATAACRAASAKATLRDTLSTSGELNWRDGTNMQWKHCKITL